MKAFVVLLAFCLAALNVKFQKITEQAIAKLPADKQEQVHILLKKPKDAGVASIALVSPRGPGIIVGAIISIKKSMMMKILQ